MVRETRYLWVGNLPESIGEDEICDHFSSYGKIQSVKLVPRRDSSEKPSAVVAFMDIKSASKAHDSENIIAGVTVVTQYNESSAAVNTSARTQDSSVQKSILPGACGQTQGTGSQLQQQPLHTGRPSQRAEGPQDDAAADAKPSEGESRDVRKPLERSLTRTSAGEYDQAYQDRDRGRQRTYPAAHNSYFSHKSHLETHTIQVTKTNDSKPRSEVSRTDNQSGSSRPGRARSRSRSMGRSQSQCSSGSGSQSNGGQSGEKKLLSVVQLPGQLLAALPKTDDLPNDKPHGLLIRGFPVRSTDSSIRDGLFHDYKKYSRLMSITIEGQGETRFAVVSFKKHEDAAKALEDSKEKRFFGTKVVVTSHNGFEIESSEYHSTDADHNEYYHKATRTLFVGNLDKATTKDMLRDMFSKFGHIIEIDIKNQGQALSYAFIQFDNIRSVVQALRTMDDQYIHANKIKLGFGKVIPSNCVWLDGILDTVSEKYLANLFSKFGCVLSTYIDRRTTRALVLYETMEQAIVAVNEMRGKCILDKKIQIDFASRDCQQLFLDNMESSGQLRPGDRLEDRGPRGFHPFTNPEFMRQRPGFENLPQRGRYHGYPDLHTQGSYNGSRETYYPPIGSRVGSRGGFYDEFPHERREGLLLRGQQKYYDPHPEEGLFYDSYERELKEYGYSRRDHDASPSLDRQRSYRHGGSSGCGGDSPRSSRYGSPLRDRPDEPLTFRYGDVKNKDGELNYGGENRIDGRSGGKRKCRGFSPANSDFSQKSKGRTTQCDSRSISPLSTKQRYGQERSLSPSSKDYLTGYAGAEHLPLRRSSKDALDCYIYSEKPAKGTSNSKSFSSKTSKSRSSRGDDSDVMSDRDRNPRVVEQTLRSKASRLIEEPGLRHRLNDVTSDIERQKKLELEITRNLSKGYLSSGSGREYVSAVTDALGKQQLSPVAAAREVIPSHVAKTDVPLVRHLSCQLKALESVSGSTTPGSKTPVNNSDQESIGGRNSHGSDEVQVLEKQKEHLLKLLEQMENASGSENDLDEEGKKDAKCIVVDDSDVEPEASLRFPKQSPDKQEKPCDGSNIEMEFYSQKEGQKPLDGSKFKPIDATQGFRKQMEAQRLQQDHDLDSLSSSSSPRGSKSNCLASASCQGPLDIEEQNEVCNSPKDIPNDFTPAKRRSASGESALLSCTKVKRMYRIKCTDDLLTSSGDEDTGVFSPASSKQSRHSSIPDEVPSLEATGGLQEVVQHITKPVGEESWSGDELLKENKSLLRSQKTNSTEVRSDYQPCIIPDVPVIMKGSDGLGPQEPRKTVALCQRESAMFLPLPKFAYDIPSLRYPASPKLNVPSCDKITVDPVQNSMMEEPPVSPGLVSSPKFEKTDMVPMEIDQTVDKKLDDSIPEPETGSNSVNNRTVCTTDQSLIASLHEIEKIPERTTEGSSSEKLECVSELSTDTVACAAGVTESSDETKSTTEDVVKMPEHAEVTLKVNAESEKLIGHKDHETGVSCAEKLAEKTEDKVNSDTFVAEHVKDSCSKERDVVEHEDSKNACSKLNTSDSDMSDLLSPTPSAPSFEEQIRALDEKLSQMHQNVKPAVSVSDSSLGVPSFDYRDKIREKYGRRRRDPSSQLTTTETRNEVSALARSLLSRISIFDQDSQRLEQLHTKYEPSTIHSSFIREPGSDPYSLLYSPVYRSSGSQEGMLPLLSTSSSNILCSPSQTGGGDISHSAWGMSAMPTSIAGAWNSTSYGQPSTPSWPSAIPGTPSPLTVSTAWSLPMTPGQSSTISQPPWPSSVLHGQPNYGLLHNPVGEAGTRVSAFCHQSSYDGPRSTNMTPPYSGSVSGHQHSVISDPRRLPRPDLSGTSPLVSPPIMKRQDSHSSDLDIWSSLKCEPVTPLLVSKPKELVSPPVSILKKQIKEEVQAVSVSAAPCEASSSITADSSSASGTGLKRKADFAFGADVVRTGNHMMKNPKISSSGSKPEGGAIKGEKETDEKSQKSGSFDSKKHVSSGGSVLGNKLQNEMKKLSAASGGSPKPFSGKQEERKSSDAVHGVKKSEELSKSVLKKVTKPSAMKSSNTQHEKPDNSKKDGQVKGPVENAGLNLLEASGNNENKDKPGKPLKAKVQGKEALENKDKPALEAKEILKEKDKLSHSKHKPQDHKGSEKPKECKDDDSRKEKPASSEAPREKSGDSGKENSRKERLASADSNKEDMKKQKVTNRESSRDGSKKDKTEKLGSSDAAKTIVDGEQKLVKDKLKFEKMNSSSGKTSKSAQDVSVDKTVKKDKPKPIKKDKLESKENVADMAKAGEKPNKSESKVSNSHAVKSDAKPSGEGRINSSSSRGEKDQKNDVKRKSSSDAVKSDKKKEQEKKKMKSEKSKEKQPEKKREVKALLQESHNSDTTAYVSMYDMVKRRSTMEKDNFKNIEDNRTKTLSQLQARSNRKNRIDSDDDDEEQVDNDADDDDDDIREESTVESKSRIRKRSGLDSRSSMSSKSRRIESSSSFSSSSSDEDDKVIKSSRGKEKQSLSKSMRSIEDDSEDDSDSSVDDLVPTKGKPAAGTLNKAVKQVRPPIYTSSSSESGSDSDVKCDGKVTSMPIAAKSKPSSHDASTGKSQKSVSETIIGKKPKSLTKKRFFSSSSDSEGDILPMEVTGEKPGSYQNKSEKKPVLPPDVLAAKSKKENAKTETPSIKKSAKDVLDMEHSDGKDKMKKKDITTLKKDLPRDASVSGKGDRKPTKVKGTAAEKKEIVSRSEDAGDAKKERQLEVNSGIHDKGKMHTLGKTEGSVESDKKGEKEVESDKHRVKHVEKNIQKQKSKSGSSKMSGNGTSNKSGSVVNDAEKASKTLAARRNSLPDKSSNHARPDVKGTSKAEKEDVLPASAPAQVSMESLEIDREEVNASLRSDNIFEKMERKEETVEKVRDAGDEVVSGDRLSKTVALLGFEKQFSSISEPATLGTGDGIDDDESRSSMIVPPLEISRTAKDRLDVESAKLSAEKMKEDASKPSSIVEAVKAIMEPIEVGEQVVEETMVGLEASIDYRDGSFDLQEPQRHEVSDDPEELTQAIQSLLSPPEDIAEDMVHSDGALQEFNDLKQGSTVETEEDKSQVIDDKEETKEFPEACKDIPVKSEPELTTDGSGAEMSVNDNQELQARQDTGEELVFIEPKPLPPEKEASAEKEKGIGVRIKDNTRDCPDYFAGYFSPYPCVPKEEVEEHKPTVSEMEQGMTSETKVADIAVVPSVENYSKSADDFTQETVKQEPAVKVDVRMETVEMAMEVENSSSGLCQKDLYEFKDDEEKAAPNYVMTRPRKRPSDSEGADIEASPVESKKPRLDMLGGDGVHNSISEMSVKEDNRPASACVLPASTHMVDAVNSLLAQPVLMTGSVKYSADPTVTPALPFLSMSSSAMTNPQTWQTNMDRVIEEVAKGNFERGHEFDFYTSQKKPRSKSRDEQQPMMPASPFMPPDLAKSHMLMAAQNFLQMSSPVSGVGPRNDAPSLHQMQMYNAGVAAARQLVSQPQIVMLSSDKTSSRLTSPLIHSPQTSFRPSTSVYQAGLLTTAMVSSATSTQQPSLLFCPPQVGYQLASAAAAAAAAHPEAGGNAMHRFLGPREDVPRSQPASCQAQTNPSAASRAAEKLPGLPVQLRPGLDMMTQGVSQAFSAPTSLSQHDLSLSIARSMCQSTTLAHNMPLASQNALQAAHNETHQQMIQTQAHLQLQQQQLHQQQQQQHQQQQQQQQQKHSDASVSTSMVQGSNPEMHGRPEYIYRQMSNPQVRFEGVPTLSSLGIVSLDSGMLRQMSPKISEGLLQTGLPRQPTTFVAHLGGYAQQVQYGMLMPHGPLANTKDTNSSTVTSSSTVTASELREALAQPSRLAQQEQIMQQQQNVLHSVRPHGLPDPCQSPVSLGQHRMPLMIQDLRSMSTSRAEPKSTGTQPSTESSVSLPGGPPLSLIQPFGDSVSGCHPSSNDKNVHGVADLRPAVQPMYKPDPRLQMLQYDQGMQLPRGITLDSRQLELLAKGVMSPHHLMVAGQMQSQSLQQSQQQQQQSQQQQAMSPFSHPDISVGRPPSVHHLQSSSMNAPQGHIARPSPDHNDNVAQLLQRFPVMWNGILELKNDRAPVQMHFVSGNRTLVPASLQDNGKPLHIGQRMRLEVAQLEQVSRRMMNESEYSMLVAVPCGPDPVTMMTAAHSLQNGFIRYLQEKQAAGIVNIYQPSTNQATYVIHIFPPCDFSLSNLARLSQDIVRSMSDANYLLIIITTC